jgi:CTP:molybdopterin cytidylyltransferase MocA
VRIVGLILAAGEGRRIGGCKALLRIGDETFLSRCVRALARPGVASVIAVIGHDAERVAREGGPAGRVSRQGGPAPRMGRQSGPAPRMARQSGPGVGAELVVNHGYRKGMLSSVLCGLERAESLGATAVLLHPVDHPLVSTETVDRVVAALEGGARIAVPSFEMRRGHPGGFQAATWEALRAAPPEKGARVVLAEHPDWVVHVPGDAGSVAGIDTREDYVRHTGADLVGSWTT